MRRTLLTTLVLAGLAAELRAQPPQDAAANYSSGPATSYAPYTRGRSLAERLITSRAMYRSRQRMARQEARRWMGVSTERPTDWTGMGLSNARRYGWSQPPWPWGPGAWAAPSVGLEISAEAD